MSFGKTTFHWLLVLVVVSWHFPWSQVSAQQTQSTTQTEVVPIPVVLKNNTLQGTVLDDKGMPAAGKTVVLGRAGKVLSKARIDQSGRFQFRNLKPGDYQVATKDSAAFLRCVTAENAPEQAVSQILLSRRAMIERGQQPASILLHPLLIGLVIAAAIAIPLAIANNDDDDAS